MKNTVPKVSVLIPAYNAEAFIEETIRSVLNQSFTDFELIIINDGSTDKTESIVRSFNDPKILLINNGTNLGIIASRNKGLSLAKGEYISFLDADDIALPERLQKQITLLDNKHEIGFCGTLIEFIGETSYDFNSNGDPDWLKYNLLFENPFAQSTIMIRNAVLSDNHLTYSWNYAEDYHLWCQLNKITQSCIIPEKLVKYRIHSAQETQRNRLQVESAAKGIRKTYWESLFGPMSIADQLAHEALRTSNAEKLSLSDLLIYSSRLLQLNTEKKEINHTIIKKNIQVRLYAAIKTTAAYHPSMLNSLFTKTSWHLLGWRRFLKQGFYCLIHKKRLKK